MKTLVFKKSAIEPILSGEEVVTLRARTTLVEGDRVAARCRRDQPPFAVLEILEVAPVRVPELPPALAASQRVTKLFPDLEELVLVRFRRAGGPQFGDERSPRPADQPLPGADAGGDAARPARKGRGGGRQDRVRSQRVPGAGPQA